MIDISTLTVIHVYEKAADANRDLIQQNKSHSKSGAQNINNACIKHDKTGKYYERYGYYWRFVEKIY